MTSSTDNFTPNNLLAAASELLKAGGYQQIVGASRLWETLNARLFEDQYNIVGIAVFETCAELLSTWSDIQGSLVDTMSRYIAKGEAKSWDGYLVLLTPGIATSSVAEIETVKYNTTRLRKLIATGEELRSVGDVERILRPLLPIGSEQVTLVGESVLSILPRLLRAKDIPESTTRLLIDAFESNKPLLERLHEHKDEA